MRPSLFAGPGGEEGGGRKEGSWEVGERPPRPLGSSAGQPRGGWLQGPESPGSQRHLVAAGRSALGPLGAHRKQELFPSVTGARRPAVSPRVLSPASGSQEGKGAWVLGPDFPGSVLLGKD